MTMTERFLWDSPEDVEIVERKKDFDPSLHPRDPHTGEFADVIGTSGILEPPASRLEDLGPDAQDVWTQKMAEYGVTTRAIRNKMSEVLDRKKIEHARVWYPNASQLSTDLSTETGIPKDRIVTAFSVCSPNCEWKDKDTGEGEEKYVTSMVRFVGAGKADGLTPNDALMKWKDEYETTNTHLTAAGKPAKAALINTNGMKGMATLMDQGVWLPVKKSRANPEGKKFWGPKPEDLLTNNKTVSFFDNIMDPGGTHEVTIDTHMMKVLEMTYGVSHDDALKFVGETGGIARDGSRVLGVGYIAIAEAVREVAARYDVSPDVAQAAFWEQVQSRQTTKRKDGKDWPSGLPRTEPDEKHA